MLKRIKMKLCYATIPMILGAYSQPIYATETMILPTQMEQMKEGKSLSSVLPPSVFSSMPDLKDSEGLLNWAKNFNSSNHLFDPLPVADAATHTEWIEALTANIEARPKEIMAVSTEIESLTKEIEAKKEINAKRYAQEGGPKISKSQKKKRGPLAEKISNLQTELQGAQVKLAQLYLQQEFDCRFRHKIGEYRVYAGVSDFFGDSIFGNILKVPALFGVSMFGPAFNSVPSPEQMRETQKEASVSKDSDTLSTAKESMEGVINALLIGGSIALNHGITNNPYLYASLLFASLYKESSMVKQYADQAVRAYLGSEISPRNAERLGWLVAIGYAMYNIKGATAFPYASPGTEISLDTSGATDFQITGSGSTLFITKTNTTNVVGKYYNTALTATSPEYSISQSPLLASSVGTSSTFLSDGVTTVTAYQIAANSGDVVLRTGNLTTGFSGPEVTLTPTVGEQNSPSLVPLPNNKFVALIQTDPTASNLDVIGYTYQYNATTGTLTLLQGPYAGNTVTTGDQGAPSAALYGDGNIGFSYQGTQSGTNKEYGVVLNPTTGDNVVPDFAFDLAGGTQGNGVSVALQNGNIANGYTDGTTLKAVITTSSGGLGTVTQFNDASLTTLGNSAVSGTATADGNFELQYAATPIPFANTQVYYSVGSSTGDPLSTDTQIPTSSNGGGSVGIQSLPGSSLASLFDGPGLIGTVITNTASTTAPTSSGGTTAPTSSGGTTAPTSSGGTTAPTSSGGTTAPTHSGAGSLQPPFISVYKGIGAIVSGGARFAGWMLGK